MQIAPYRYVSQKLITIFQTEQPLKLQRILGRIDAICTGGCRQYPRTRAVMASGINIYSLF